MALNKFMHPKNPYKNNRPDFKKLAIEHEDFRQVAQHSLDGKVSINFKDPVALRALCKALMKSDFQVDIDMPADRLIPTIPQRVNYLLWIKDILEENNLISDNLNGIDVGCGACCVYGIIGCKMFEWHFIATELDPVNLEYASRNVETNKLGGLISVLKADDTLIKSAAAASSNTCVDFCMCNPPFFDSDERKIVRDSRAEPKHVSTASSTESLCSGGEIEFIKKLIDESIDMKTQVRFYTSLLGKKSSLVKLKQYLKDKGISNFATTEFCQGRTMRWGLAWSFFPLQFPKSLFQHERNQSKSVYSITLPKDCQICQFDVPSVTFCVRDILTNQLKMSIVTLNQDVAEYAALVTARKNTWSHNRRKRRQEKRENKTHEEVGECSTGEPATKYAKLSPHMACSGEDNSVSDDEAPLIAFSLEIKLDGSDIKLSVKLIDDGQKKDMLHQILQYLKNRLK